MNCPACGAENLPGLDRCDTCGSSLEGDLIRASGTGRWRAATDPISSLDPSTIVPQVAREGTALDQAISQMCGHNVGYLMIVDEHGLLTGILTEHDILRRIACQEADLSGLTVDDLAQRNPTALQESDPIAHALHFMALHDFMYIPVVDERGRPVDLLSFRRVIRLLERID